jgi:hypothetical protein
VSRGSYWIVIAILGLLLLIWSGGAMLILGVNK